MNDFSNKVVYMTADGAKRMFGNTAMVDLPVVPTDACNVDGTLVYGDIYCKHNGARIGGCLSQDGFTDTVPSEAAQAVAVLVYNQHSDWLDEQYGDDRPGTEATNVETLLATPARFPVPTLEERAREINQTVAIA